MFKDIEFSFGFYHHQKNSNEMVEVKNKDELTEVDNQLVFGLKENVFFENETPLYHGNIYFIKEKNEFIVFHFVLNRDNNNISGYGFSYFDRYFNNFYNQKKFLSNYKNCTFEFVGNIFIHHFYLLDNFSKKINLSNIFYNLLFNKENQNLKVIFNDDSIIYFSLNKEKVDLEKKLLYKSLNHPNSSFNLRIQKEVVFFDEYNQIEHKEIIEGYNNSIFSLMEGSFDEIKVKNSNFLLFLKDGLVRVISSELEEVDKIPLPFMEENWTVIEEESNLFLNEFLKLIS